MRQHLSEKYLFHKSGNELASELYERVTDFQDFAISTGVFYNWYKNKEYYENRIGTGLIAGPDVADIGDEGEIKSASVNHFRNVLRHMLNSVTSTVPSFTVSASNTDLASRKAARLGKDILNYYFTNQKIDKQFKLGFEQAIVYGDSYIMVQWDPMKGQPYAASGGVVYNKGDIQVTALSPTDVFFAVTKKNKEDFDWIITRTRRNKYDVAAENPEFAEEIESFSGFFTDDRYITIDPALTDSYSSMGSDDIYVYQAFHRASPTLPKGKQVTFVGTDKNQIMLYEGPNLYRQLPVFPLNPSKYLEIAFGFTEANVLRVPQTMHNIATSSQMTALNAFGVANIWTPEDMEVNQLVDGMNVIKTAVKPEVLELFQENPSIINVMNQAERSMETLSGQNSVVRGNVQDTPNLKSGVAISLVQASAQAYNMGLELSAYEAYESVGNFIIETLRNVAKAERIIQITGKSTESSVRIFKAEDLAGAGRVSVERINAIAKTPAGRAELGMNFLQNGVFGQGPTAAQKMLEFINTGNLNTATESEDTYIDFVAACKEKLMRGERIEQGIPGINHQHFLKEIHSLILDLDVLENQPEVLKNVTDFINMQMKIIREGDELSMLIYGGQQPLAPQVSASELQMLAPNEMTGQAGAPPVPGGMQ